MRSDTVIKIGKTIGAVFIEDLQAAIALEEPTAGDVAARAYLLARMVPYEYGDKPVNDVTTDTRAKIIALIKELSTPNIRTPFTRANLLAWAKAEAKKTPDFEAPNGKIRKNKPVLVLCSLLTIWVLGRLGTQSNDLLENLRCAYWYGSKGFADYSIDELLDKIMTECKENEYGEYDDLEAFLEECGEF